MLAISRRRRVLIAVAGGFALVLLASPTALGDALSNVAPASQVSGLSTEFPLGNYALDSHFSAISVGLFSGVNVSGVPPMIAYFLANTLWQLTAFLANALITLFTFAFSLDLVNGSQATGGAGALAPVSSAVHTIYSTVFGAPWLTVAVVLAGMWAMWKALVQRRYVETAGALALSLVYVVIALAFVTEPQATIGSASRWTNEMSSTFLSLTSQGNLSNQQQAKQADADQLFDVLVYQPWVVLQFGGVEHCVTTGTSNSVAVQPLSASESQALANGTEIQVGDRTCINNANKYAVHFLRYSPDDNDRTDEYTALEKGDSGDLPSSDPSKASGSYKLGPADEPAADAMGAGGQYQRLLLAIVIFAGELGAFLLLGVLSVAVILAQIIVLLLLAFAPVALVLAVFPGRGHEFFLSWLTRLATFLLRKAVYSLILAVLLAVAAALDSASADLGWLMSFGLEATFFWAVFLYRHQLTSRLSLATTGYAGREDQAFKFAALYAATRVLRPRAPRTPPQPPPQTTIVFEGGYHAPNTGPASGGGADGPTPQLPSGPTPGGPNGSDGSGGPPPSAPQPSAGPDPDRPSPSTDSAGREQPAVEPSRAQARPERSRAAAVDHETVTAPVASGRSATTGARSSDSHSAGSSAVRPRGDHSSTRPATRRSSSRASGEPATRAAEPSTARPDTTAHETGGVSASDPPATSAATAPATGSTAPTGSGNETSGSAGSPLADSVRRDLHRLTPRRPGTDRPHTTTPRTPTTPTPPTPPRPTHSPQTAAQPAAQSPRSRVDQRSETDRGEGS